MTKCLKKLKTKGKICINLSLFPSCGVLFPHHLRDLLKIFLQVSPPHFHLDWTYTEVAFSALPFLLLSFILYFCKVITCTHSGF